MIVKEYTSLLTEVYDLNSLLFTNCFFSHLLTKKIFGNNNYVHIHIFGIFACKISGILNIIYYFKKRIQNII